MKKAIAKRLKIIAGLMGKNQRRLKRAYWAIPDSRKKLDHLISMSEKYAQEKQR